MTVRVETVEDAKALVGRFFDTGDTRVLVSECGMGFNHGQALTKRVYIRAGERLCIGVHSINAWLATATETPPAPGQEGDGDA